MNRTDVIVAIHPLLRAAMPQERGFRNGFMLPGRSAAGLVVLLCMACTAMPLHASDLQPLTVAIVESSGGKYFEPDGRRIVIRTQPMRLFIRIRNTSESAVAVRARPEMAFSLEMKDKAGQTVTVKRKKEKNGETKNDTETDSSPGAEDDTRVDLAPGTDRIVPMVINRGEWDGLPDLEPGKEINYTARVIYETVSGQLVYSEAYALTFSIPK
jgi:hypothetical protein